MVRALPVRSPRAFRTAWSERTRLPIFWAFFLRETVGRRRLSRLIRPRLARAWPPCAHGPWRLPASGTFTLAANHFAGRRTLDTIAALLAASHAARPDLTDRYLLITGKRARKPRSPLPARLTSAIVGLVFRRWDAHVLRIPLGNTRASVGFLREWRRRAQRQPCLVFPEGRARPAFAAIRPGAGRWLATLGVPVLPVGVWWQDSAWQVRAGAPIRWSPRPELRDAQLGLAIAALLPPELADAWQPGLARWHAAHLVP